MAESDSDDAPCLSQQTLLALQEFYASKEAHQNSTPDEQLLKVNDLEENWQLSQFWYDDETAEELCAEALNEIEPAGKVALIGCPSLYYFMKKHQISVQLLDIDKRFSTYKDDFVCYDFNLPILSQIPKEWKNTFDLVILDPPFLSEDCFIKCALTATFLSKQKIIVCTGAVMESFVKHTLNANKTQFEPKHKNNLANEFSSYINYRSKRWKFIEIK